MTTIDVPLSIDRPLMRAAVFTEYGGKVQIQEINGPELPKNNEILIAVEAVSINPVDWKVREGAMKLLSGSKFPKIPGRDLSGIISHVGPNVARFQVGDEVFGMSKGTWAENVLCTENMVAKKPANLNWNEAASVPLIALTAHQSLFEVAQLKAGQNILILGGGSAVGMYAIQMAKLIGANIWATASPQKEELLKSYGLNHLIDYKHQDFVQVLGENKMDVVFDIVGRKVDRDRAFDVVKSGGVLASVTPNDTDHPNASMVSVFVDIAWKKISKKFSNGVSYQPLFVRDEQPAILDEIAKWLSEGKLKTQIDSVFPLNQIQEANERSESGKVNGKVVVVVKEDS